MPLTAKGEKVLAAMKKEYGPEKGERVFYASANKGKIKGVHGAKRKRRGHTIADAIGESLNSRRK